jgi:hypothetical protein
MIYMMLRDIQKILKQPLIGTLTSVILPREAFETLSHQLNDNFTYLIIIFVCKTILPPLI